MINYIFVTNHGKSDNKNLSLSHTSMGPVSGRACKRGNRRIKWIDHSPATGCRLYHRRRLEKVHATHGEKTLHFPILSPCHRYADQWFDRGFILKKLSQITLLCFPGWRGVFLGRSLYGIHPSIPSVVHCGRFDFRVFPDGFSSILAKKQKLKQHLTINSSLLKPIYYA
jgi:hypothetical protein